MKQIALLTVALILTLGSISCNAQDTKKQATQTQVAKKVEVYYFHFTRRCTTCNAVELEAKSAIESLYAEQFKNGLITFTGVNLDEENSKAAAAKCKAAGQSLLIISGDKRIDLTTQGFMYAVNNPDKLREEMKKAIDPLLASK
jgi:hypothetical protein